MRPEQWKVTAENAARSAESLGKALDAAGRFARSLPGLACSTDAADLKRFEELAEDAARLRNLFITTYQALNIDLGDSALYSLQIISACYSLAYVLESHIRLEHYSELIGLTDPGRIAQYTYSMQQIALMRASAVIDFQVKQN